MEKNYYIKTFWKNLPTKSYIKLLFTIFFIFSIIGFAADLFDGFKHKYDFLIVNIIFSGLLGVLYAHTFIKQKKLFPVVLIIQLLFSYYISDFKSNSTFEVIPDEKYIIFGIALIISIILAYLFLMLFVSGEAIPQIKMKAELDLAKEMHEVLVPEINQETDKFIIYGKSIPVSEVGGDLVDFKLNGENLLCYIADVTGHGVSSGLFMGMFKTSIHTILLHNNSLEQIFNFSNKALSELKKQNIFLTAAGVNFIGENIAEYSIAGHLPIIHFNSKDQNIYQLLNKQIPISVKKDFVFKSEIIQFNSGDIFVLLSDGFTEVFDKKKNSYGIDRIIDIVKDNTHKLPEVLFTKIQFEVNKFGKQIDDQSILIVKCK